MKVQGRYRIDTLVGGKVVRSTDWIKNLVVDDGKEVIIQSLIDTATPVDNAKIGTGTTAAAAGDTDLETPSVSVIPVVSASRTGSAATFEFFLSDSQLSNGSYTEFGVFGSSTLIARSIISPTYTKASNEDTRITYEISIT